MRADKYLTQIKFEAGDHSKEYKVKKMRDSIVYI